jgi:hypothetical protein
MNPPLTPDQENMMAWLESQDVEGHDAASAVPEAWEAERRAAHALGSLLRSHTPAMNEGDDFAAAVLRRLDNA